MSDVLQILASGGVGSVVTGVVLIGVAWLRRGAQQDATAGGALGKVLDRMGELDDTIDELRKERKADVAECERKRQEDKRRCDQDIDALRAMVERSTVAIVADVKTVAKTVQRGLPEDDTGVHKLERVVRRTPTPLPKRYEPPEGSDV